MTVMTITALVVFLTVLVMLRVIYNLSVHAYGDAIREEIKKLKVILVLTCAALAGVMWAGIVNSLIVSFSATCIAWTTISMFFNMTRTILQRHEFSRDAQIMWPFFLWLGWLGSLVMVIVQGVVMWL